MNKKIYYYNFKPLNAWLVFNVIITLLIGSCLFCGSNIWYYPQVPVLIGVVIFSWIMWWYKYIHPQIMAVITDESIKIDHNNPLKWKDIAYAEECEVYCFFKPHKVIALVPHDGIDYKYNWMQKNNPFPAFSIPLYNLLSPQDEAELTALIDKKIGLKKLKQ
ncbi:MAG: hypothetical protein IKR92_06200 [Alphaproteobacteria bacterium]|nr:hypothetical protein [Alphaproteobacteria bacterium]